VGWEVNQSVGIDKNHGEKVEKSQHTFKKIAKFRRIHGHLLS